VRVAAISDIHGNLTALEAVLADVERESVSQIVVAGDSFSGPWPAEVVDLLEAVGARIVRGNADRVDAIRAFDSELGAWNERHLGAERLAAAAEWPLTTELAVAGLGAVLVCHATPTDDESIYTRITPDEAIVELLGRVSADVVVCGHTHIQYDRTASTGLRIVNPGSVGMPYEGRRGAFWALLGPDVEFRCSEYDVEAAVAAIRVAGAPVGDRYLRDLLQPPDPVATTEYFESLRGA
jgi:putative phosphoesterase